MARNTSGESEGVRRAAVMGILSDDHKMPDQKKKPRNPVSATTSR